MEIRNASPELREFVSEYLIEQMVPVLRTAQITRREAAVECLRAANFGAASTAALVDKAVAVAIEAAQLVVDALLKGEYKNVVNPQVLAG